MIRSIHPHDEKRQKELQQLLVTWLIANSCPLIIVQINDEFYNIENHNTFDDYKKEELQNEQS
ncbi:608_t:CDS:2 [Dentiscutata erythropus]|uniref:608_t:CDS:1 n=1 Tax=Dentiscutata erythropus TaxID=1348616 RepID=A0A9N9EVR3_9GLOM|nr:608_t:CDS:2 [Dentiscutata erythropus]